MAYVISDECVACGTCAEECPAEAISEGDGKYVIDADTCLECGTCEAACPTGAISGKVLARVHSHDDRFVYKHTVCNPKRYGAACEGIMSDENDRFLTKLCKLRARTRSKRFYCERCPSKCNAAK